MAGVQGSPIHLLKTAFVIYHHADLEKARQSFLDFGLDIAAEHEGEEIFFKGYGTEPVIYIARKALSGSSSFGGAAYAVESREELSRAEKNPGATSISILDAPGGGEFVTLIDPAGHKVHLIYGQEERAEERTDLEKLVVNYEDEKPRKGRFQRFEPGRAPVHRWGHYGVTYPVGMYEEMFEWYTKTISLAPSDLVHRDGKPITCFFHIDRKEEYTDHHSFFFKPVKPGHEPGVAHSAFEVASLSIPHPSSR